MIQLENRIALVTGGGRGIGKGCALALAGAGADIVLNDRPGSPDLAAAAEEIRQLGRNCWPIECDAHSREGCQQLLDKAIEAAGRIEILVSNPAFSRRGAFLDYDPELWDRTIRGTLSAGFHLAQLTARHFVERGGGGKIVFISSVHSEWPLSTAVAYNAAKAGLNHLTRSIAVELMQHRINVNAIAPGWIDTPGERETFSDELMDEQGKNLPWGRMGLPADIGNAAAFLCSNAADYITGEILTVDGGIRYGDCLPSNLPQSV